MHGTKWSFLLPRGPGVVVVKCWDMLPCDWDKLYFG